MDEVELLVAMNAKIKDENDNDFFFELLRKYGISREEFKMAFPEKFI